jgi:hypothetical protein
MALSVSEQMRGAVARIEAALSDWENPEAKRVISQEISLLARVVPIQREKISSLRTWVRILYSAHKHQHYGGPATVKAYVQAECRRIRQIASQIESAGQR